ncbi:cysteine protease 1-like [Lolium perenne]|uniref:cysteine protease 1-like n=1 Tax=Lolium perenne TaxID=4522 RepID=UPI0021F63ECE|nr:cysteine protease 1-like [Lolium perenne]
MASHGAAVAVALLLIILFGVASPMISAARVIGGDASEHGLTRRTEAEAREMYDLWLARHGRLYNALGGEYDRRFRAFRDNLDFVDAHNARAAAGKESFRLGMNRFADLTNAEFRAAYLGATVPNAPRRNVVGERYRHDGAEALPEKVDWREKGAVAPVKNQGQCGSCWAFSTVCAVEGINKIVTGELVTLSEQELVDCARNGRNSGCHGGIMDDAFEFIARNGGLDTEEDYPYTGREGKCDLAKKGLKVVSIDGFEDVPANDELSLKKAVAHQPVSVAIEAGGREFQLYESGVFTGRCGTQLDHAVVAVGYGTEEDGREYWIVRNSWGPGWGEGGYVRMERNASATTGNVGKCGIAMYPSYPVKNGDNPKPAPAPTPVSPAEKCDRHSSCPAGSTCCCTYGVRNVCLAWGCCPAKGATCCRDRAVCCPSDYPVCNAGSRTCAKSKGSPDTVEALPRTPATRQRTPIPELVDFIFSF